MAIEKWIRVFGWSGVGCGALAIYQRDIQIFLVWQLLATISGFLWTNYLQKKVSWDTVASLVLTILAVVTKDQYLVYTAMWVRSVSYQLVFEVVVKDRLAQTKGENN